MTERDALLDLQSRWAAVGVETVIIPRNPGGLNFDRLVSFIQQPSNVSTWVRDRERWQIGTMPPEALRVFVGWLSDDSSKSLDDFQAETGTWGDETFPDSTIDSVMNHLAEEVHEFFEDWRSGQDKQEEEAADVVIMLLHYAHKNYMSLADAVEQKMAINRTRTWNVNTGTHIKHSEEDRDGK